MRAFKQIQMLILLLALASGGCIAGERISPAALQQQIEAGPPPQLLDVRTQAEYDAGHVPGAMLVPHDQLAANLGKLDASRPVVVYCRSGRRAGIAEALLREHGFEVTQVEGSWQGWQQAGLPEACPEGGCTPQPESKEPSP